MNKALDASVEKTQARFHKQEAQRAKAGGFTATAVAATAMRRDVLGWHRLADYIRERLKKRDDYGLRQISPDLLASVGVGALANWHNLADIEEPEPARCIAIGLALQTVKWDAGLLAKTRKKITKETDHKVKTRMARAEGYRQEDWSEALKAAAGNWFEHCCVEAMPDVFEKVSVSVGGGRATTDTVEIKAEAVERLNEIRHQIWNANPLIVPSAEPLKPWTGYRKGGFWDERSPMAPRFVRTHYEETDKEIQRAFDDGSISSTPTR